MVGHHAVLRATPSPVARVRWVRHSKGRLGVSGGAQAGVQW
jgi:hypothetical protein